MGDVTLAEETARADKAEAELRKVYEQLQRAETDVASLGRQAIAQYNMAVKYIALYGRAKVENEQLRQQLRRGGQNAGQNDS